MRDDDLVLLREKLAELPPLNINRTIMTMNGWTEEALMIGRVIGSLCDLIRSGEIELDVEKEDHRG